MLTPAEVTNYYSETGVKKSQKSLPLLFAMSIAAGAIVALTAAATNTLVHTSSDVASVKLIAGLTFPFALVIVILMGFELFTGNCLISISVLDKRVKPLSMVRNLVAVYTGNFIGAALVALACVYFGQLDYTGGLLGAYTIKVAAAKSSLSFGNGFVLGVMCNILVCAGIICSYTAKDTTGRFLGAYAPVALFVFAGFEHSVANMYYITAGLLANNIPAYANLAVELGIDASSLTVANFFLGNLLPVTLGNIVGGCLIGLAMWIGTGGKSRRA